MIVAGALTTTFSPYHEPHDECGWQMGGPDSG